jgi:DNA-binding response OmpR family regulator
MTVLDLRGADTPDRRTMPRGGRRATDVPGQHPPVLVGDSDDGARRVFARALERFGFRVCEAATGEEALALVEECSPCVVIAESTLPRDDALQSYIRICRIPQIVTVTDPDGVVPSDAAAILEKPFALTALLNEVFRILRAGDAPIAA